MRPVLVALATLLLFASVARSADETGGAHQPSHPAQNHRPLPIESRALGQPAYLTGIASMWQGPGAATHDCRWPWTDCAARTVTSLDTGRSITVVPHMYCDCYVGRIGPNGETERLIDLDPSQVRALGLDARRGLWRVRVELVGGTISDTAMSQ